MFYENGERDQTRIRVRYVSVEYDFERNSSEIATTNNGVVDLTI